MKFNVMVFPCGSASAVDINTALKDSMVINLYGGSSISNHGEYVFKNYIGNLPNISDENFIDEFNKAINEYKIDFIIPTHDTVAMFLSENEKSIHAEIVTSEYKTSKICRHKKLTYDLFKEEKFMPRIYSKIEDVESFPVYIKPNVGAGGQGCLKCNNRDELIYNISKSDDLIICEYLPGEELTIDCFTDKNGNLRFIGPRLRDRTFNGISSRARNIELSDEINNIAVVINKRINLRGYWFFQLKKDQYGKYKLLEVATRLAGTSCLNRNLDINFPLLSVLDKAGYDIDIIPNKYDIELDRTLISRYKIKYDYDIAYIDLDDTLILRNNSVNTLLMMFIYQCKNKNIDLVLITKHIYDVHETLEKYNIDRSLFNKIIKITKEENKYNYIDNNRNPIFIDNSFYERKCVKEKYGIPTFDVSNVESLIDWRG